MEYPKLIEPVFEDTLAAIARKAFGRGAELKSSRLLTGGQFNTAYLLETRSPDVRAVLRIAPPDNRSLFTYEREMMEAEPWIYERIAEAGVPAPRTIALDASRTVIDRVYIVQEFVDALPLNHADVPAEARAELMREAGRLAARIHAVRGEEFGWPVGDGSLRGGPSWTAVFGDLLTETCEAAVAESILSPEQSEAVHKRFTERQDAFDQCVSPVLVHNDIWAPNVLVARDGDVWSVKAIIDADRALFADREFEYILWDDDAFHDEFMDGYGAALDPAADAVWRRLLYRFYWYLFAAWCYRAQIWRPEPQAWSQGVAMAALQEILASA